MVLKKKKAKKKQKTKKQTNKQTKKKQQQQQKNKNKAKQNKTKPKKKKKTTTKQSHTHNITHGVQDKVFIRVMEYPQLRTTDKSIQLAIYLLQFPVNKSLAPNCRFHCGLVVSTVSIIKKLTNKQTNNKKTCLLSFRLDDHTLLPSY